VGGSRATRFWALGLGVVLTAAALGACGDDEESGGGGGSGGGSVPTVEGYEIGAGVNDPEDATIAVLQFLPAKATVPVDTPITWKWSGTEPHSVTFTAPGVEIPPPGADDATWFAPQGDASAPYDGSATVSSGLQPLGAPAQDFQLTFSQPGTYSYYCVIHPQMVGTLDVVADEADAEDPNEIAARGASERDEFLAEGRAAKQALESAPAQRTSNPDGSSTWTVQMGASTPNTDILAFAPVPAEVKAGDSVTFVNESAAPHTASFFGEGAAPIQDPTDPRVNAPAPGPSPQVLRSTGFANTGLLPPNAPPGGAPPLEARSFTFQVPAAGTYSYVCILHAPSNMIGTITAS